MKYFVHKHLLYTKININKLDYQFIYPNLNILDYQYIHIKVLTCSINFIRQINNYS